jgi:hypothetical protein
LDEIGFAGTQKKRTAAQVKKDIEKTVQYIKTQKSVKVIPLSKRNRRALSKAK